MLENYFPHIALDQWSHPLPKFKFLKRRVKQKIAVYGTLPFWYFTLFSHFPPSLQDLVSLSRKGASRVSVAMLLDEDKDKVEDIQSKSESGLGDGHSSEQLVGVAECAGGEGSGVVADYEAELCGDFEYDQQDPEVRVRNTHIP